MMMMWNLQKIRRVTQVTLGVNAMVIFFIINMYSSKPTPVVLIADTRATWSGVNVLSAYYKTAQTPNAMCTKRILLFGMRQHWFEFCSFPEFAHYKYLITFPRVINCQELDCSILLNHSYLASDIPGYDVVIFTNVDNWLSPEMWDWVHGNRSSGQRWVMITEESPMYVPGVQPPAKYANSTYDWFDSYKSDSDFVHPYGYYQPYGDKPRENVFDVTQLLAGKSLLLAWMGSHCETLQWDRQGFVDEFQKIIHVDKFGKCGDTEVAWNDHQALYDVLGKYKFYLSLENSCCDDYITEKFWRTLEIGLVPVVVGAPYEYYVKLAPPNSFIHADRFDSLSALAIYLIELNDNDAKYQEYFKWKTMGELVSFGQEEQYVRPLTNETHCAILNKYLHTDPAYQTRLDYFGMKWHGSCHTCGSKHWLNNFMYDKQHARLNNDIWA